MAYHDTRRGALRSLLLGSSLFPALVSELLAKGAPAGRRQSARARKPRTFQAQPNA